MGRSVSRALVGVALLVLGLRPADGGDCVHSKVNNKFGSSMKVRKVGLDDSVGKKGFWIHPVYMPGDNYTCVERLWTPSYIEDTFLQCTRDLYLDHNKVTRLFQEYIPNAARTIYDTFETAPTTPQLALWDTQLKSSGGYWIDGAPDTCGHVNIKNTWIQKALNTKAGSSEFPTRPESSSHGIDLLLIVTLVPVASSSTTSWGGPCVVDYHTGLPRVAFLNVNPAALSPSSKAEQLSLESFILHDLLHIMGFSPMYWERSWGLERHPALRTPDAFVADHTACSSAERAADAWLDWEAMHWDKKLFHTEILTELDKTLDTGPFVLSGLTLGYFASLANATTGPISSTYVTINTKRQGDLRWGKERGCEWFRDCRHLVGNSSYPEFCATVTTDQSTCNFLATARGDCNAMTLTQTPVVGVFDRTDYAAQSTAMANCPIVSSTYVCTDSSNSPSVSLESFGSGSRCVTSATYGGLCMPVCCTPRGDGAPGHWKLYIDVPTTTTGTAMETLSCDPNGLEASITSSAWGTLTCPDADQVCGAWAAEDQTAGNGIRWFDFRPYVMDTQQQEITIVVDISFSVALEGYNLSIVVPADTYYHAYEGDVTITATSPKNAPTPTATWYGTTLTISSTGAQPCHTVQFEVTNFTTPAARGDYGAYRLTLYNNDTAYESTSINPYGDNIIYYVTATTTASTTQLPTATRTDTTSESYSRTFSKTETLTLTESLIPPTTTVYRTATQTYTDTNLPYLPCYCYGRGNCREKSFADRYPVQGGSFTSVCICEEGYTGRFCQVKACGAKTCGKWGQCSSPWQNKTVEELHTYGSQGMGSPLRLPHPWMLEIDKDAALYLKSSREWRPDPHKGYNGKSFTYHSGVDGLGWFHLCPDTPAMEEFNTSQVSVTDITLLRLEKEPYNCALLELGVPGVVGEVTSRETRLGEAVFNVTMGWLVDGLFTLTVNVSNSTEGIDWENATDHMPYTGANLSRARVLFIADYASDERSVHEVVTHDITIDMDPVRLPEDDLYYFTYGVENGATPYTVPLMASRNVDPTTYTPPVVFTLVPGSVLEWVNLRKTPLLSTSRVNDVGDHEVTLGTGLTSQHWFIGFGGTGDPYTMIDYAVDNLLTIKDYECTCLTNTTVGTAYVDITDPKCERCISFTSSTKTPAYPPGDCTQGCPCEQGSCDLSGTCICPPHFVGQVCEYCAAGWYPAGVCNVYCDPPVTCLNRGLCNGYGTCVCEPGFTGARCEKRTCNKANQCNGYGSCVEARTPLQTLREIVNDPNSPAHPLNWEADFKMVNDWNEDTFMWLDGGADTFDGWGNFSVCTASGCAYVRNANRPFVEPVQLTAGRSSIQLYVGWLNSAVFVITVEVDDGEPAWLQFGGTYGGEIAPHRLSGTFTFNEVEASATVHYNTQEQRPDVVYAVGRVAGGSRMNTDVTIDVANGNRETITTQPLNPGEAAPVVVLVHWGHTTEVTRLAAMKLTALLSTLFHTAHCKGCDKRGGTWCDQCMFSRYPAPSALFNPATAPPGNDTAACVETCNCQGPGMGSGCFANGSCLCTGNRGGIYCETCKTDYYNWPHCDVYCNELMSCSGSGVCNENGRCNCFLGTKGFSCHFESCSYASCGSTWNSGASQCASPYDSAYRLLWKVGDYDSSNREFKKPLLRSLAQGEIRFNVTDAYTSIPGSFAGPNLTIPVEGLDVNEFNPFTMGFMLPNTTLPGHCWLGSSYAPDMTEANCTDINGRWDHSVLCYNPTDKIFASTRPCPYTPHFVYVADSQFMLIFKVIESPMNTIFEYYINGNLLVSKLGTALNTATIIDWSLLRWGAYNEIQIKVVSGGGLQLDYAALEVNTNAASTAAGLHGYYDAPIAKLKINSNIVTVPKFNIDYDLIKDTPRGLRYFAEGGGLLFENQQYAFRTIFDKFGNFQMCLQDTPACTKLMITSTKELLVWPFRLGNASWVLTSEFRNELLTLHVEHTAGTDHTFSLSYGGNYSTTREPRKVVIYYQSAVFNNFPSLISSLSTFAGKLDDYNNGHPQLHAAVVPSPFVRKSAPITARHSHHRLGLGNYTTEEFVQLSELSQSATFFLQWGFTPRNDFMRYIFKVLSDPVRPVCTCTPPFAGTTCESCSGIDCNVKQCFDSIACSACKYPATGPACQGCLSGYSVMQAVDNTLTCQAKCPSSNNCNSKGVCKLPEVCVCYPGFYTKGCNTSAACLSECIGPGYTTCEKVSCYSAPQPGLDVYVALCPYPCENGVCSRQQRKCTCDAGWGGIDCTSPWCSGGATCYGHGVCTLPNVCECQSGWTGINCETSPCGIHKTCSECIHADGCGWCALSNECYPGDYTGPYSPGLKPHPCSADARWFKTTECFVGFTNYIPIKDDELPTVNFLNCSRLCIQDAAECGACMRTIPESMEDFVLHMQQQRSLLQVGTATATQMETSTVSLSLRLATHTVTPDVGIQCGEEWVRWQWMPTALINNYVCACELEASLKRDISTTCLQESMWQQFDDTAVVSEALAAEATAMKAKYISFDQKLSVQQGCCNTGDVCCKTSELLYNQDKVQETVDWYVNHMVPIHVKVYENARAACGCSASCTNHQRDSLWRLLTQTTSTCVQGSIASILLHPCQLNVGSTLQEAFPVLHPTPPCPMKSRLLPVVLGFPTSPQQEAALVAAGTYRLPQCAHWTTTETWACCSQALRCYSNCTASVAMCNTNFVHCITSIFRCAAFVGVQQFIYEVEEISAKKLYQSALITFSAHQKIRSKACRCVPVEEVGCGNGIRVASGCVCFDGWLQDSVGICKIPECRDNCKGNGVCVKDTSGVASCKCRPQWKGVACEVPVWRSASAFGLGHITTWDGLIYKHYGDGAYQLVTGIWQSDTFSVQVHKTYHQRYGVSTIDAVTIRLGSDKVDIWSKNQDEVCIVGGPKCLLGRGLVSVHVNGEPFGSGDYSWQFAQWPGVTIYSVTTFHDATFFLHLGTTMKVKVGVVWSSPLNVHFFNVDLSISLPYFSRVDGMMGFLDGDVANDINGIKHDGTHLKNTWTDYHYYGETWMVTKSELPVYTLGRPILYLPISHNYAPTELVGSSSCEGTPHPFYVPCSSDDLVMNDTAVVYNEFMISTRYCHSNPCRFNGACNLDGSCECPMQLNASRYCTAVTTDTNSSEMYSGNQEGSVFDLEALQSELCGHLNRCSGHGRCTMDAQVERCICDEFWTDTACSTPLCGVTCTNGRCEYDGTAVGCRCRAGYTGPSCSEIAMCPHLWECSGHGLCTAQSECACHTGWHGESCNVETPSTCSVGLTGKWCTSLVCDCSGHGYCTLDAGQPTCQCSSNWYSANCGKQCIPEVTCTGHGLCSSEGTCQCTVPYRTGSCDVRDPSVTIQSQVKINNRPTTHQQGVDLTLGALINGAMNVPTGQLLRWSSYPSGLFGTSDENSLTVQLKGNMFACADSTYSAADTILHTCSYKITAELSLGISVASSDSFTMEILEAPRYKDSASVKFHCPDDPSCNKLYELRTYLTIDAGLWISNVPPFTYKFQVTIGSVTTPIFNGLSPYHSNPTVTFRIPALPCSAGTNTTLRVSIFAGSGNGALASLELPDTKTVFRLSDSDALAFLRGTAALSPIETLDVMLTVPQRYGVETWPWDEMHYAFTSYLDDVLSSNETGVLKTTMLSSVMVLYETSVYPTRAVSCPRVVAVGVVNLDYVTYGARAEFLFEIAKQLIEGELSANEISEAAAMVLIGNIVKIPALATRLMFLESLLEKVTSDFTVSSVSVKVVPSTTAVTNYGLNDIVVFTHHKYNALGEELVMAAYEPGSDRSFTFVTEAGITVNILLESEIINLQARNAVTKQTTGVSDPTNTSTPIATLMFSLSNDINYARSYNCVYWERSQWIWGPEAGIGLLAPASHLDVAIVPAGFIGTSYGCPVTHFSMFALAFVQEVVPATPVFINDTTAPFDNSYVIPPQVDIFISNKVTPSTDVGLAFTIVGGVIGASILLSLAWMGRKCYRQREARRAENQRAHDTFASKLFLRRKSKRKSLAKGSKYGQGATVGILKKAHQRTRDFMTGTKGGPEWETDNYNEGLPAPPEDREMDEYLAQRDLEQIERVVNLDDLPIFDPTRTEGVKRYAYHIEGDSGSEPSPKTAPTSPPPDNPLPEKPNEAVSRWKAAVQFT